MEDSVLARVEAALGPYLRDDLTAEQRKRAAAIALGALLPATPAMRAVGSDALDEWYTRGTSRTRLNIPASAFHPVLAAMVREATKAHE